MIARELQEQIRENISENITNLRSAVGMTQYKFAETTDVAPNTLSKYVNKESIPHLEFFIELRNADEFKRFDFTIDEFITKKLNFSKKTMQSQATTPVVIKDNNIRTDYLGNYLIYFFDQTKGPNAHGRDLRYGVLTILEEVHLVGDNIMKTYATFFKEPESAYEFREKVDELANDSEKTANYYMRLPQHYSGETNCEGSHCFINMKSDYHKDQAFFILYAPPKAKAPEYIGGLSSVTSISRGRIHMPTMQKAILTRYALSDHSQEELADYLKLNAPVLTSDSEMKDLTGLFKKLYLSIEGVPSEINYFDESDRQAILRNRINQLLKQNIEANSMSVSFITEEEDARCYKLIKAYAVKQRSG